MRIELEKRYKERLQCFGRVDRFGLKKNYWGYPSQTICIADIKDQDGKLLTNHVWFTIGKTIEKANLAVGDLLQFEARITQYIKGLYPYLEYDYKLSHPTKLKKIAS